MNKRQRKKKDKKRLKEIEESSDFDWFNYWMSTSQSLDL